MQTAMNIRDARQKPWKHRIRHANGCHCFDIRDTHLAVAEKYLSKEVL